MNDKSIDLLCIILPLVVVTAAFGPLLAEMLEDLFHEK